MYVLLKKMSTDACSVIQVFKCLSDIKAWMAVNLRNVDSKNSEVMVFDGAIGRLSLNLGYQMSQPPQILVLKWTIFIQINSWHVKTSEVKGEHAFLFTWLQTIWQWRAHFGPSAPSKYAMWNEKERERIIWKEGNGAKIVSLQVWSKSKSSAHIYAQNMMHHQMFRFASRFEHNRCWKVGKVMAACWHSQWSIKACLL